MVARKTRVEVSMLNNSFLLLLFFFTLGNSGKDCKDFELCFCLFSFCILIQLLAIKSSVLSSHIL